MTWKMGSLNSKPHLTADVVEVSNDEHGNDDELISEPVLFDHNNEEGPSQNEQEFSDADSSKKSWQKKRVSRDLFKAIVAAPGLSIASALNKWVEEGKYLARAEISLAMRNLQNRRMYGRALQFSEWLEANKRLALDINVRNYIYQLDRIAKVHGLQKAENYIGKIPKSFGSGFSFSEFCP